MAIVLACVKIDIMSKRKVDDLAPDNNPKPRKRAALVPVDVGPEYEPGRTGIPLHEKGRRNHLDFVYARHKQRHRTRWRLQNDYRRIPQSKRHTTYGNKWMERPIKTIQRIWRQTRARRRENTMQRLHYLDIARHYDRNFYDDSDENWHELGNLQIPRVHIDIGGAPLVKYKPKVRDPRSWRQRVWPSVVKWAHSNTRKGIRKVRRDIKLRDKYSNQFAPKRYMYS